MCGSVCCCCDFCSNPGTLPVPQWVWWSATCGNCDCCCYLGTPPVPQGMWWSGWGVAAFVVAVTSVPIKIHYLCRSECGDLWLVATVTSVPIQVHYLCRIECGDLRGVTAFVVAVVAGDDVLPLHHLLHDHLVNAPAYHHHPVILPLISSPIWFKKSHAMFPLKQMKGLPALLSSSLCHSCKWNISLCSLNETSSL